MGRAAVRVFPWITREGVRAEHLEGFFVGWTQPPADELFLASLRGCSRVALAWDGPRLVGFACAISDGQLFAFITLLEVLPEHQGRGIGSQLVRRLVADLEGLYAIDLCCDHDLVPHYEKLGFTGFAGAGVRRPEVLAR